MPSRIYNVIPYYSRDVSICCDKDNFVKCDTAAGTDCVDNPDGIAKYTTTGAVDSSKYTKTYQI